MQFIVVKNFWKLVQQYFVLTDAASSFHWLSTTLFISLTHWADDERPTLNGAFTKNQQIL